MTEALETLTEKEKETLRLLLRGHDAKSSARELDLSVHTINERLRTARRKLSVTSSREAARLLMQNEGETTTYENPAYKGLGDASGEHADDQSTTRQHRTWLIGGILMSVFAALLLLSSPLVESGDDTRSAQVAANDAEIERAARSWLTLVDASNWEDSFEAAGSSFQELNTVSGWAEASHEARVPFGAVSSRELVEVKYVNAPPRGYRSVVFFTKFASGAEALEMVTLEREQSGWRVVGYIIE